MSFRKKSKMNEADVPEYANAKYNTGGLFGSSTNTIKGTTYTPTKTMSNIGKESWSGLYNALKGLSSTDYSKDKNYQVYSNNLQRQMKNNYNNNVLSNLANNGLMRSSGLQAATNAFNDTLANQTADLYDRYFQRNQSTLSNYQGVLNDLYKYMTGSNTAAQMSSSDANQFNQQQYNNKKGIKDGDKDNNSQLWGNLARIGATIASAMLSS